MIIVYNGRTLEVPVTVKRPKRRAGDRIARIAQPLARMIDRVTRGRTRMSRCQPCKNAQARLNRGESIWRVLWLRLRGK